MERESIQMIYEIMHDVSGIHPELYMEMRSRKDKLVRLRQIMAFFLRKYLRLNLKDVGELQGQRDHTTIIYSVRQVESWLDGAPGFGWEKKLTEQVMKIYGEKCEAFV